MSQDEDSVWYGSEAPDEENGDNPVMSAAEDSPTANIGDVFILPEDAEIHGTRVVLQGTEITTAGDDRMADSFQQFGHIKVRLLRVCPAVNLFLDKLSVYGLDSKTRRPPLSQEIRAPFNKTTMSLTNWKLSHDKIEIGSIPVNLSTLLKKVEENKFIEAKPSTFSISSTSISLLAFASAPKLSKNCHDLPKNLAGLTLAPNDELRKQDFDARRDLLRHLKTYLASTTATKLLSSIKLLSSFKKLPEHNNVATEIENVCSFVDMAITENVFNQLVPLLQRLSLIHI